MNYKPGLVVCPRTNKMVPLEQAIVKMKEYALMPLEYKAEKFKDTGLYLYEPED